MAKKRRMKISNFIMINIIVLQFNNGYLYINTSDQTMWFSKDCESQYPVQKFRFDFDYSAKAPLYKLYSLIYKDFTNEVHSHIRSSWDYHHFLGLFTNGERFKSTMEVYMEFGVPCTCSEYRPEMAGVKEMNPIFDIFWRTQNKYNLEPFHSKQVTYNNMDCFYTFLEAPEEIFTSMIITRIQKEELAGIMNIILSPFKLINN